MPSGKDSSHKMSSKSGQIKTTSENGVFSELPDTSNSDSSQRMGFGVAPNPFCLSSDCRLLFFMTTIVAKLRRGR